MTSSVIGLRAEKSGPPVEFAGGDSSSERIAELQRRVINSNGLDREAEAELWRIHLAAKLRDSAQRRQQQAEHRSRPCSEYRITLQAALRELERMRYPGYPKVETRRRSGREALLLTLKAGRRCDG